MLVEEGRERTRRKLFWLKERENNRRMEKITGGWRK
jgi:hypothetical protein